LPEANCGRGLRVPLRSHFAQDWIAARPPPGNKCRVYEAGRLFAGRALRSRRTYGQVYLLGPGLINKAPSPNRSIPPIHSSWLDKASMPIWLFNERRLPIKPNAPQTQKRPMRTWRPNVIIQRGIVGSSRAITRPLSQSPASR
jgi:hypothetical protein